MFDARSGTFVVCPSRRTCEGILPAGAARRHAVVGRADFRSPSSFSAWLGVVLVVVLFSGGRFGYDQGVIFGVLTGIKKTFALSPRIVEVVTSWVT